MHNETERTVKSVSSVVIGKGEDFPGLLVKYMHFWLMISEQPTLTLLAYSLFVVRP